jgi:hypothetical protein
MSFALSVYIGLLLAVIIGKISSKETVEVVWNIN